MKLLELISAKENIDKLVSLKIKPVASYHLGKFIVQFNQEFTAFTKARNDLIIKHGKIDEKTKHNAIAADDKDAMDAFNKDLQPLLDQKVTIKIPKITPSDIEEAVEPYIFAQLSWLIKE
jgi:hypothetical protein